MAFDFSACRKLIPFIILGSLLATYLAGQADKNRAHVTVPAPTARRTLARKSSWPRLDSANRSQARILQKEIVVLSENSALGTQLRKPEYHRYWDGVNCTAIFAGNKTVIDSVNRKIQRERSAKSLMPLDSEVARWTANCELYKRQRGYPKQANSEEESRFPLAYIILTHKGSAQLERLLRAIYQPQNIYCIHPDAKSPSAFHRAISGLANCFDNVFVASKLEDVQYAGYTLLKANINCVKDLAGPPASIYPWKYMINLCGQDFPLKTNLEIVQQLKAYNGHNDIKAVIIQTEEKSARTKYKFTVQNKHVVRTERLKEPFGHNLTLYTGSAYFVATREFIYHILNDPIATDFLHWLTDSKCPEETYWATLQRIPGMPGGDNVDLPVSESRVRFVVWSTMQMPCHGKYVRMVCIFRTGDLRNLQKQPHLFANKFYYEDDPVTLQCLERALEFRTSRHL